MRSLPRSSASCSAPRLPLFRVACLLAWPLLAPSACAQRIDAGDLEKQVRAVLEGAGLTVKSTSCPSGREVKPDDAFECKGELQSGKPFQVSVRQIGGGKLDVQVVGRVFRTKALGDAFPVLSGARALATCPDEVLIVRQGDTIVCDVKSVDGASGKATFTATDDNGSLDLKHTLPPPGPTGSGDPPSVASSPASAPAGSAAPSPSASAPR